MSTNEHPQKGTATSLLKTTRQAFLAYLAIRPENFKEIDSTESELKAISLAKRIVMDSLTKHVVG